jgi:hypothetical protein
VTGETFALKVKDDVLKIDNASVVKADIETSNGIIHVIDQVLIPAEHKGEASRQGKVRRLPDPPKGAVKAFRPERFPLCRLR